MGVLDYLKFGIEIAKKSHNVELQQALLDAQEGYLNVREENLRLKEKVKELEKEKEVSSRLEFDGRVYRLKEQDSEDEGTAFCQVCWDSERKMIHLQEITETIDREIWCVYLCMNCNKSFYSEVIGTDNTKQPLEFAEDNDPW